MYTTKKRKFIFSLLIRGSKVQVLVEELKNQIVAIKIAAIFFGPPKKTPNG